MFSIFWIGNLILDVISGAATSSLDRATPVFLASPPTRAGEVSSDTG